MESIKTTIAGFGYVGYAHYHGLKNYHDVTVVDPAIEKYNHPIPQDSEAIIICVSTPQNEDGSCDVTNVLNVIENSPDVPILIKSTISLEGWNKILHEFPDRKKQIHFSPEFLRADFAYDDFKSNNTLLIGGKNTPFWHDYFVGALGPINFIPAEPKELILIKYFRNSFLATKVAFFNQIYDLCQEENLNYEAVAVGVGMDSRIGYSHIKVTEERGYGGHCFPKDINAIINTAELKNVDLSIIKTARDYNSSIRKE